MKNITLFVIGLLFSAVAVADVCHFSFQVNDGAVYDEGDVSQFVEKEVRVRLSRIDHKFDILIHRNCGDQGEKTLKFGMSSIALYIQNINGVTLESDVERYTDDNLELSKATINTLFDKALDFGNLAKKDQQNIVKMFAYVIAESARFEDIDAAVEKILTSDCRYQWEEYKDMVRRWKTMSIFANSRGLPKGEQYLGGYRAFLIAPITSKMVEEYNEATTKEGWKVVRYGYGKPRETDKAAPIPVGEASCG